MSLELPHHAPPIPMNAKDSEFLQRRPELFFPYTQHAAAAAAAVQQQQQFNSSMAAAMAAAAAASAAAANGMNSTVTTVSFQKNETSQAPDLY